MTPKYNLMKGTGENMEQIAGQIMTRPVGRTSSGKVAVMVYGIVSVDDEKSALNVEGTQFQVSDIGTAVDANAMVDTIQLVIQKGGTVDRSEIARGNTPGGVMMEPIWRTA